MSDIIPFNPRRRTASVTTLIARGNRRADAAHQEWVRRHNAAELVVALDELRMFCEGHGYVWTLTATIEGWVVRIDTAALTHVSRHADCHTAVERAVAWLDSRRSNS